MRRIVLTLDQLRRAHPGGIGTYVRSLASGLRAVRVEDDLDFELVGLAPHGPRPDPLDGVCDSLVTTPFAVMATTRLWHRVALGVPRDAAVVHASTLAGPFGGSSTKALHTVTVQDLLWRDHPELSTPSGVRFHEHRLGVARARGTRIVVTSERLRARLIDDGFASDHVAVVRLGADHHEASGDVDEVWRRHGYDMLVGGRPFVLSVGTVEPRKNLERLITAHRAAMAQCSDLGPLVIVGAPGWGDVSVNGAIYLGALAPDELAVVMGACRALAYVPYAEGWGLPPVEALALGRPVVASRVPSTEGNAEVITVDPNDTDNIAAGLVAVATSDDSEVARARRRDSVRSLTWENCARDHLRAWS